MHQGGEENKESIKNYQNHTYRFHCKGNLPVNVACGTPGSRATQFSHH
jgi:hypothetical protein